MTKESFVQKTGINVSNEEFEKINGLYYNVWVLEEDTFCEDFKKHSESVILKTLNEKVDTFLIALKAKDDKEVKAVGVIIDAIREANEKQDSYTALYTSKLLTKVLDIL